MFKRLCLLLFAFKFMLHSSDGAYTETFKRCCDLGTKWAEEDLNCSSFPTPVAGIASEQQPLCLSSVEICCVGKHRESQCKAGEKAAKSGKSCAPVVTKSGTENYKDCCEACKMGIIIGSAGGPCDPKTFGPPWDVSFLSCCHELLPTTVPVISTSQENDITPLLTSTITSTTTTTEFPITGTEPSSSSPSNKPEASSTDPMKNRNKISSLPPTPSLESLCETLADELCAHKCIPVPGSYRCECRKGFMLMADGKSCQQRDAYDRCKINNPCEQQCFDTGVAVRCSCNRGYKLNPDKVTCTDIDECENKTHKCERTQVCVNEPGTYTCLDVDPNTNDPDYDDDDKEKCPLGYQYDYDSNVCSDLDECKLKLHECSDGKVCKNTIGSYVCVDDSKNDNNVECPPGYAYKTSIESCADIDECSTGRDDCNRDSQICLNTQGSFTCQNRASKTSCPAGFKINMIGLCEDIDECKEANGVALCNSNETCVNEQGGYRCVPSRTETSNDVPLSTTHFTDITSKQTTPFQPSYQETSVSESVSSTSLSSLQPPTSANPPLSSLSTTQLLSRQPPHQRPTSYQPYYPPRNVQPQYPTSCKLGFKYVSAYNRCVDIDECLEDGDSCDSNQECRNTVGSFTCICKTGYQLDHVTGACIDINECQIGAHDCNPQSQRCDNTIGSYQCVRFTSCGTGYTLSATSGLCEDDDECALGTDDCRVLGPQFQCRNTLGSYRCERKRCISGPCFEHKTVYTSPTIIYKTVTPKTSFTSVQLKKCLPGYVMNKYGNCEDINECETSPCPKHQKCINTNGSFRCISDCSPGYQLSEDGTHCEDIDECATRTHKCTEQQRCINRNGYHICQCPPGHKATNANQCEDINECEFPISRQFCGYSAECENTIGSYRCRCKEGFRENVDNSCSDIDECKEQPGLCQQTCINYRGGYRCGCQSGFTLNADNRTCTDTDECELFKDRHLCIGICQNTPGSYTCRCPDGYRLGSDGRTCIDIDECTNGNICPNSDDICWNIRGSYRCKSIQCPSNYIRDPEQKNRCKRTVDYCHSRDTECMRKPSAYSYNFITFVSRLPLPSDGVLDLFTMRGPLWNTATVTFNMEMINVRCPHNIPKADKSYFRMQRLSVNEAVLSLVRVIEGPQEVEMQMTMEVYENGEHRGSALAKIFVIVSEYEF